MPFASSLPRDDLTAPTHRHTHATDAREKQRTVTNPPPFLSHPSPAHTRSLRSLPNLSRTPASCSLPSESPHGCRSFVCLVSRSSRVRLLRRRAWLFGARSRCQHCCLVGRQRTAAASCQVHHLGQGSPRRAYGRYYPQPRVRKTDARALRHSHYRYRPLSSFVVLNLQILH